MFCPTCGRDNTLERKFCATCGTNLAAVSQALAGSQDDFFTKMDSGLDHFLGKYAEHVFKSAPANAAEQRVGKSWQVLGQSVLATFVDLLLFTLMWNVIPLRFLLLVISTPVRLVTQRGRKRAMEGDTMLRDFSETEPDRWLPSPMESVTDHTTAILADTKRPKTRA